MGDENLIRTLGDYSKPSHEGYMNTIELPVGNNVVPLRSDTIRRTIDQAADGKLRDRNAEESWALLEDLALYDNESWNDPRDFAKPVSQFTLPQDVRLRLIRAWKSVQCLMEAHLASTQPTHVNKITTSCEIYEVGGKKFTSNQGPRNFYDAANTGGEKLNFNWKYTQTSTSPHGGLISIYSSSYQMKLEKALLDFDSHQNKRHDYLN
ncbi:hypothetical protein Tco_0667694 [Tanacetum coccineum]